MKRKLLFMVVSIFLTIGAMSQVNVLSNGDFEEQGAWERVVRADAGHIDALSLEFGNTTDTPQYGTDGCLLMTWEDSSAMKQYLLQKITLKVGETYKFSGSFKDAGTVTADLGGWWHQINIWPAIEDKVLNADSIAANGAFYFGPDQSGSAAVMTGISATGAVSPYGADTVYEDFSHNIYGDKIGLGSLITGQGDTSVYIVPAVLQRATDNLELGTIGTEVDYWFFIHNGQYGTTQHNIKLAIDEFSLVNIVDDQSPNCEISSEQPEITDLKPFTVSFNFKEAVTGFDLTDVVVGNGTASNLQETALSTIWSADITPTVKGDVTVDVVADAAADAAGNGSLAAAQFIMTDANILTNGDFEEQGAWERVVRADAGHIDALSLEFGNTADTPQYGDDGCLLMTWEDSSAMKQYLLQKITLKVGETYKFSGAFKDAGTDTTDLGGWWHQVNLWPAVEDQVLNADSITANGAFYFGPDQSGSAAVLTGFSATGADSPYGADTVYEDFSHNIYGDKIGLGSLITGQGDTTVYIVPAVLQRATDNLELGAIGDEVDYWFFMHAGQYGATQHDIKFAFDNFVLKNIEDDQFPNCEISSEQPEITDLKPFTVSFNFKEAVTGFGLDDIVVGNGTASNLQETALSTIWSADITPSVKGDVTVDVAAGAAEDAAGNVNYPAEQFTMMDANILANGDFEEQGVWERVVRADAGDLSALSLEFGNTTDTPQYGDGGCLLMTWEDSSAMKQYLLQKITLKVGETYKFSGAFKDAGTNTTLLGGWWHQINMWPAIEDQVLNADSITSNGAFYFGPDQSGSAGVLTGFSATGAVSPYGADTVYEDFSHSLYGDYIGRGQPGTQGDTTVYIVPAVLQRDADNLELGAIGDEVDYWFFIHAGQYGTDQHEIKFALDNFVLKNIVDDQFPNCEITSDQPDTTNLSPFTVSINFKEAVTGIELSDIVVGNGTASNLQETALSTIWSADITPAADGEVTVDVAAGVTTDAAGNVNYSGEFSIVYEDATGLAEELSAVNISMYPNPSEGLVNLKISNRDNNELSLSVIDITGRSVWQKQVTGFQINESIDLTGVAKGYYILNVSNGQEAIYKKMIIH